MIMITARAEPGTKEKAMSSGATCFLRKPFEGENGELPPAGSQGRLKSSLPEKKTVPATSCKVAGVAI